METKAGVNNYSVQSKIFPNTRFLEKAGNCGGWVGGWVDVNRSWFKRMLIAVQNH